MKIYYVGGTIGDAYVILCKLYTVAKKEKILCRHYTAYERLRPVIKDIYSLIPNISVEFISERSSDIDLRGAFRYRGQEREQDRYGLNPEYYPEFDLGTIKRFDLPPAYEVLQIKAGTGQNRSLDMGIARAILSNPKLPTVIVGEYSVDLQTENPRAVDLRGKTSIKEVINIIKGGRHFFGPPGFLSFVAVSHKVFSTVYLKSQSESDVLAIQGRIEAVEQWRRFLIKR